MALLPAGGRSGGAQPPTIASNVDQAAAAAIGWAITPNAVDRPATALEFAERLDSIA